MTKNQKHMGLTSSTGCVICREITGERVPGHVHHIAEGSGARNDFLVACLCELHHTGGLGVHGMGVKAFLNLYSLPTEYHLMGLVNKFLIEDGRL